MNDKFKKFFIYVLILFNLFFIYNYGPRNFNKFKELEKNNLSILKAIDLKEEKVIESKILPYNNDREFIGDIGRICSRANITEKSLEFIDFKESKDGLVSVARLEVEGELNGIKSLVSSLDKSNKIYLESMEINSLDKSKMNSILDLSIVSDFTRVYKTEEGLYNKDYFKQEALLDRAKDEERKPLAKLEKKDSKNIEDNLKKETKIVEDRVVNNHYRVGDLKFINQEYENIEYLDEELILFYFNSNNKGLSRKYITEKTSINLEGNFLLEFWLNSNIEDFDLGIELQTKEGPEINKFLKNKKVSGWNYYKLLVDEDIVSYRIFVDVKKAQRGSILIRDLLERELIKSD